MKLNKKIFIILLFTLCIVSLLFGSVAYYRFLVSGNINGSTGNAVFNVTGFKDDSSSIKTIELGKVNPGDSGSAEFWNYTYGAYIRTITFGNDLSNKPESCAGDTDLCWDVSYSSSQNKKVYAYLVDSGLKDSTYTTKSLYNLYIVSDAPIFAPTNCNDIFGFKKMVSIEFNNNFNTSKVTTMYDMFDRCSSLTNLDLSNFNTSNVTNVTSMFGACKRLQTQINIMNTGTTSYSNMFGNALDDPNAYVIIGYTESTQSIAEAMKMTANTNYQSKITLKQK